ncbi:MAG: zinc-dependent metalloproteinase lipoprotein [Prevotella sp.]|nr:zinc-dependent metalloproteinase lipoprotein [Prevotella sp.]MBQ6209841.1 zinc-dependent metalloproteinase lipoprotein [Prevotella sp.]
MKSNKHYLLLLLCMVFLSCGGDDGRTETNSSHEDDDDTEETIDDNYTYKIPVIFHVLYADQGDELQYVPTSRLSTILQNVNDIYKGGIYGESENINIKFFLATKDEKGNTLSTPGVEYVKWNDTYPIDPHEFMMNTTGEYKKYIWDPNDYVNIMVYNFAADKDKGGITLGISHMPYVVESDSALAGLETVKYTTITKSMLDYPHCSSINSLYINQESTRYTLADKGKSGYTYNSSDVNVTLAHELGHYFGLHHMYTERDGEPADSCGDTDYCEDTPSYNRVEYNAYQTYYIDHTTKEEFDIIDLIKRSACDGTTFYSANIMDYAISFGYKISSDQKDRIRSVLYYSPLMPGPRKKSSTVKKMPMKGRGEEGPVKLPIRVVECKMK